jgi:superfamily I DNA and RNA helicase
MLQVVIGQNKRNMLAQQALIKAVKTADFEGTLYLGYPIIATADQMVTIDALLTTREHGVVAVDFLAPDANASPDEVRERQDDAYNAVFRKLLDYKPLVSKRTLSVPVNVLSFGPEEPDFENEELICAGPDSILERLQEFPSISSQQLKLINAAIQRVTTIKPSTKRTNVEKANSRGAVIQKIEKEIANLDQWQKSAAIECPEGPQRIRGLAGSGKTIVLALKAAYLHAANPDWDIALTFHTRALYQQFRDLVRRFCFEHKNDEPDWNKLRVLHSWGSSRSPGVYSEVAAGNDLPVRDFAYAKSFHGGDEAFGGVCDELLGGLKSKRKTEPLFDAILIDEAQDLPKSFFEICYLSVSEPKRIVWAYDELQNLGSYSMAPPSELFGTNERGEPRVPNLDEVEGTPKRDIVLPVCYRNTPWALSTAHAIGFGIYRPKGLVQFFDDAGLWQEIGYRVENGELAPGHEVTLRRRENSYPQYFTELLRPEDSVSWHCFDEYQQQFEWVADQIRQNLGEDELKHTDILVVIPDAIQAKNVAGLLTSALDKHGIQAHLAGVTSSVDRLYQEDSVAITSIYRAKGNEAAMVYVVNAEYAAEPFRSVRGRNVLFTAITRSRAWVRICGSGPGMKEIIRELESVRDNDYRLKFRVPTAEALANIRKIHRDMSAAEIAKRDSALKNVEPLLAMLESGELPMEALPDEFKKRLHSLLGSRDEPE